LFTACGDRAKGAAFISTQSGGITSVVVVLALAVRPRRLTVRHKWLGILTVRRAPTRAREQVLMDIETLDTLNRTQHRCQEQLCVPLVPANTYWYLSAVPELLALAADRVECLEGEAS